MLNKEKLKTTSLVDILNEITNVSKFQDGIMLLIHQEINPDLKEELLKEYDKAQNYYKLLNGEIMSRWGFDLDHEYNPNKIYKR